jgi:hypothetical protein
MAPEHTMRTFPIEKMTDPHGRRLVQVYEDYWWVVNENDELYFYGTQRSPYLSPQCNMNRSIAEKLATSVSYESVKEVRQIPLVFVPVRINDYI